VLADPAGIRSYLAMSQIHVLTRQRVWCRSAGSAGDAGDGGTPGRRLFWAMGRVGVAVYGAGSRPASRGALVSGRVVVLATVMLLCLKPALPGLNARNAADKTTPAAVSIRVSARDVSRHFQALRNRTCIVTGAGSPRDASADLSLIFERVQRAIVRAMSIKPAP